MALPTDDLIKDTGLVTTAILTLLGLVRFVWLRMSKDKISLAGDAADLGAIQRLESRVKALDERLTKEETAKRKMAAFMLRAMAVITCCSCEHAVAEREKLQKEFEDLMDEMAK